MRARATRRLLPIALPTWLACVASVMPIAGAAADGTSPLAEPENILILAPWYISAYPELADFAQQKLADGAREVLQADPRFAVVDQPTLDAEESAIVHEHLKLFLLVAMSIEEAKISGRAWLETKRAADYRLGEGLSFLAGRSDARFALVILGSEIEVFSDFISTRIPYAFAPVSSTGIFFALADLSNGRIVWYNRWGPIDRRRSFLGISDAAPATREMIEQVFSTYPRSPAIQFKERFVPASRP